MSTQQLNALGPEELKQHARQVVSEARHAVARAEAEVAVAAAAVEATPMDAREDIKAAVAALLAAKETEGTANMAMARAEHALFLARAAARLAPAAADWAAATADWAAATVTTARVAAIANLDILHRQQMMGDWDEAGKLIKRHTSKNRKKTKRRKQKIAKRIKGTKRRK